MAFVYTSFFSACDLQRRITIEPVISYRFEDIGPGGAYPYRYSQDDLTFEFLASDYSDWRIFATYDKPELQMMRTTTFILESSIRIGFQRAKSRSALPGEYDQLMRNIRDGMLALATRGGDYFRHMPDFRLEFVETAMDIPKHKPRPSDLNTVTNGALFEGRLALRDYENNTFFYKQYGSHNVDKGITITRIDKFEDKNPDDPMPYIFSQADMQFEFRASTYRGWNSLNHTRPHTATYVIEESIRQGLVGAYRYYLNDMEYQELMNDIRDGMWSAETRDGRVPAGFRLEFVDSVRDAPKWPPRTSS